MEGWGLGHPGPGIGGGANAGGSTWERVGDLHWMDGAPLGIVNTGGVVRRKGPEHWVENQERLPKPPTGHPPKKVL